MDHRLWCESAIGKELTADEAIELFAVSMPIHPVKGEALFEEGDKATAFFLIVEGEVSVVKKSIEGEASTIATLGAGAVVGEMSLLTQDNRSAAAVVEKDATLLKVPWNEFETLLEKHPVTAFKLVLSMARMMAGRLRSINAKVSDLMGQAKAAGKQVKGLEEFADFKQKVMSDWSF